MTLREAFEGSDRQDLLRRIANDDPQPPRRINPAIPAGLETILLKSMAKSAAVRYATAKDFADDLRRFLGGKPVLALSRTSPNTLPSGEGVTRPSSDRPPSLAVPAAGCAGGEHGLGFVQANSKTKAANLKLVASLTRAEENWNISQTHFRNTRLLLDDFGVRDAEELAKVPGAERLRQRTLENALSYYHKFIDLAGNDPTFHRDRAVTYTKIGTITQLLGEHAKVLEAYVKGWEIFRQLAESHPVGGSPVGRPRRLLQQHRVARSLCRPDRRGKERVPGSHPDSRTARARTAGRRPAPERVGPVVQQPRPARRSDGPARLGRRVLQESGEPPRRARTGTSRAMRINWPAWPPAMTTSASFTPGRTWSKQSAIAPMRSKSKRHSAGCTPRY